METRAVHLACLEPESLLVRLVHVLWRHAHAGPVAALHDPLDTGRGGHIEHLPADGGEREEVLGLHHQVVLHAPGDAPHGGAVLGEEEQVQVRVLERLVLEGREVGEVELPLGVGRGEEGEPGDASEDPADLLPLGSVEGDVHVVVPRDQAVVAIRAEESALEHEKREPVFLARAHKDVQGKHQLRAVLQRGHGLEPVDHRQLFSRLVVPLGGLLNQLRPELEEVPERVFLVHVLADVRQVDPQGRRQAFAAMGEG